MEIDFLALIISIALLVVVSGLVVYLHMKTKELMNLILSFPSANDLAKEIIKIKVPLSELPPEMVEKLKQKNQMNHEYDMPPPPQVPSNTQNTVERKLDYVG